MATNLLLLSCLLFGVSAFAKRPPTQIIELSKENGHCRQDNVVVVVHGTKADHRNMLPLGQWLTQSGHCAILFEYRENQLLSTIARRLSATLGDLIRQRQLTRLTVIAHSMGGLIARKALTEEYFAAHKLDIPVTLISVATPFAGFKQANRFNRFLYFFGRPFGAEKTYLEIGSRRDFIRRPGKLYKSVQHFKIETIERGWSNTIGNKTFNDDILSLEEQRQPEVDQALSFLRQLDIGHNACVNKEEEVSAQLELVLDQLLLSSGRR